MIHPSGYRTAGVKGAATQGTYQVTEEHPGLATWRVTRDCDMFLANLSSAEPGTRQGRFREVKRPSLLFPEQLGMSEDKRSNVTLFLTSSVTQRDPITVSAPLQLHPWKGGLTPTLPASWGCPDPGGQNMRKKLSTESRSRAGRLGPGSCFRGNCMLFAYA